MAFDYFYGAQSQQFAFYRIPKVMFTDNRFQNISTEGKVLYGHDKSFCFPCYKKLVEDMRKKKETGNGI